VRALAGGIAARLRSRPAVASNRYFRLQPYPAQQYRRGCV